MSTFTPNSAYYSVRQAAVLLGVEPSRVARAVRLGTLPTVRRRDRLVVPARALVALLDRPASPGGTA
jgi:hypothetical protein